MLFSARGSVTPQPKELPYPKPCCFGDVVDVQGPVPGRSPAKVVLPKTISINAAAQIRGFCVCKS